MNKSSGLKKATDKIVREIKAMERERHRVEQTRQIIARRRWFLR